MAEGMRVEPDLDFIKYLKSAGGDTLKKCYQCATCSVVCPLSSDDNPFPRKEMVFAQWGLKDKLVGDANVMLCHQCGDCTAYCPRGAKPGDVLGAIRAYAYTHFGFPQGLAKLCSSGKNLPMLIGIPALLVGLLWILSGGTHIPENFNEIGFAHFFGHWEFPWLSKNVAFIDAIFLPAVGFAVFAAYRGATNMWKEMEKNVNADVAFRPSAVQFVRDFLWPSVVEIIQHKRFNECGTNKNRVTGHLPLMLAFIALFVVTNYGFLRKDILAIVLDNPALHNPIPLLDPFKLLANVAAIALIIGIGILWVNRSSQEEEAGVTGTFYDWFLIGEIMAVGVTGLGAELLRLAGLPTPAYVVYYMHLVSVLMLFVYMPYTKFAHMVYRTVAMAFEKYRESGFVKQ